MKLQLRPLRFVALTVVVSMPLLGMAGVASAKTGKNYCINHPNSKLAKCQSGGGSSNGGGTGAPATDIAVTVAPNPLVETGQSEVLAVVEVETLPSFAGDAVSISSTQLVASCESVSFTTGTHPDVISPDSISVILDDDGNATVGLIGTNCAPGTSVIEADLEVAPYLTALTTLVANPPVVTAAGLTGYPNNEVETGDTSTSGDSDVYAVFYVEDNPVYAEQTVEISSTQLLSRCGKGWQWIGGNNGGAFGFPDGTVASTTLDDDGNAVFLSKGASCAAGDSEVIAEVMAGTHDTFTFDYTIDPPVPTI